MESARRLGSKRIEARAAVLLFEYQARFGLLRRPPVPVDLILEHLLTFILEFDNLHELGIENAHGATSLSEKRVVIDERLDTTDHPEMVGRFNFTVAHEIGHIWLRHPPIQAAQLLSEGKNPRLVGSSREVEWQADKFAAYLLMPRNLVLQEWRAKYGNTEPLQITAEVEAAARESGLTRDELVKGFAELAADELAPLFKVSTDAMRIRLQELGLVPDR